MPKVTGDAYISDASDVAHDEPLPIPVASNAPANGANDSSDSEEQGDDDEYQVETILAHDWKRGVLKYEIKWVGYEAEENTWEPVENLLPDARDILSAYHKRLGYDPAITGPTKPKSKSNLKRSASGSQSTPKKFKKDSDSEEVGSWLPTKNDWEPYVDEVTHIERDNDTAALVVYVNWKNGKKTKVSMGQIYSHCPRPMLKFYEKHLKFTSAE